MLYLGLNFGGEVMYYGILLEMRGVTVSTRPAGGSMPVGLILIDLYSNSEHVIFVSIGNSQGAVWLISASQTKDTMTSPFGPRERRQTSNAT